MRVRSIVTVAVLALSALATPAAAAAGPNKPGTTPASKSGKTPASDPFAFISPADRAKMQAQAPYSRAAKQIQMTIVTTGARGYAGIAIGSKSVKLWWHGAVPADVAKAIDRARRSVPVQVKHAAHSRLELKAAAAALVQAMASDPASRLHRVEIPVDGSRVIAVVEKGSTGALLSADGTRLRTSTAPTGRSVSLVGRSGIPIRVVEGARMHLADGPATRWNDGWCGSTPCTFSGGGAIQSNDGGWYCTAGFGVRIGGQDYMLTAGHCGRPGGSFDNGNDSLWMGYGAAENVGHDLLLLVSNVDHWMWDGGATTNNFVKDVIGWDWARAGESVCLSGATSGVQCGITNSSNFTDAYCDTDHYGNYECYNDLIEADRSPTPAAPGDSGGPVFTITGCCAVYAKGTVSGYGTDHVDYQDFGTAWRDFGVVPVGT
jgi:streptogrisin D